jgi:O-acetyl-ADP-ribose deacetylase (regulator of RNase III)
MATVYPAAFHTRYDVILNPVNCMGVSGAGLARAFKEFFPDNQQYYEEGCRQKGFKVGRVEPSYIYFNPERFGKNPIPQSIVNFPTKMHWKDKSDILLIENGLSDMAALFAAFPRGAGPGSVAIPRLGCGLGGLSWEDVQPVVLDVLKPLMKRGLTVDFF